MAELFRLQDLNSNGLLEEEELCKLNEKIAMLHKGKDVDKEAVRARCRQIFRTKLDPEGRPVPYANFRQHMFQVLTDLDSNSQAQEMMLEQFIAEAKSARAAFHFESLASETDAAFLSKISLPGAEGPGWPAPPESSPSAPSKPAAAPSAAAALPGPAPPEKLSMADRVQSVQSMQSVRSVQSGAAQDSEKARRRLEWEERGAAKGRAEAEAGPEKPAAGAEAAVEAAARDTLGGSVESFVPSPREDEAEAKAQTVLAYAKGERLQVWSKSKSAWLDGVVEEAFATACSAEGYSIPPGTLKVRSAAGVKWVMAGQDAGVLRKLPA
mmetsp:Transcript_86697/g.269780  ORF Transcript_86697/g.269780 Transcript_86697/m.269780 type:complete len:325 (+) Transcript_86697:187-1161(+)